MSLHPIMRRLVLLPLLLAAVLPLQAEVNEDLRIHLMVDQSLPAPEAFLQRLLTGQNVQAIIERRGPAGEDSRLIDPMHVEVSYAGEPIECFVYMRGPQAALVFALLDAEKLAASPSGELSMAARFIGSSEPDAGWVLPVEFSEANISAIREAQLPTRGRAIQIVDETGAPIPGALLFGQRREDLFARADANGTVMLTAPTRNTAGLHYAWADGFWTTGFDPVSSRTITLAPFSPGDEANARREVELVRDDGSPLGAAVLVVGDRYYLNYEGAAVRIEAPAGSEVTHMLVVRADSLPERLDVSLTGNGMLSLRLKSQQELEERLRKAAPPISVERRGPDGGK